MGAPNCSRVLAYSRAMSKDRLAGPDHLQGQRRRGLFDRPGECRRAPARFAEGAVGGDAHAVKENSGVLPAGVESLKGRGLDGVLGDDEQGETIGSHGVFETGCDDQLVDGGALGDVALGALEDPAARIPRATRPTSSPAQLPDSSARRACR